MLEKHRLTYLDHLGIDNYMPRRVLPCALPSQLLSDEALQEPVAFSSADMPVDPSREVMSESTVEHEHKHAEPQLTATDLTAAQVRHPSPAEILTEPSVEKAILVDEKESPSINSIMESPVNATVVIPVSSPEPNSAPSSSTTKQQAIRFALNVWRINADLMVIDSRQPGAALPTDRLLQNILRSINCHLAQLPPSELLRWPLFKDNKFKDDKLSSNEDEARAMVQAYISAQCSNGTTHTILLLGKDAIRFALTIEDDIDSFYAQHKGTALLQPQWKNSVLIAPSLIDMLQDPMQKCVMWNALQTLLVKTAVTA
jgi:hypothetical protein